MSFRDLDLKNRGWQEIRKADLFDSWERTRMLALYSITNPSFKGPSNGRKFFNDFQNPYAEKKVKKAKPISLDELNKRLARLDTLTYTPYRK